MGVGGKGGYRPFVAVVVAVAVMVEVGVMLVYGEVVVVDLYVRTVF